MTNPWFKRGTLFRHALEALRTATGPVNGARRSSTAILAAKGVTEPTAKGSAHGLEAGLRASLEKNHAGKTVERVGDGVPRRWQTT